MTVKGRNDRLEYFYQFDYELEGSVWRDCSRCTVLAVSEVVRDLELVLRAL